VAWNPGAGAFEAVALDLPPAGPHDLTVAVAAASVDPVDLKLRAFAQPTDAPRVRGVDGCGTVTAGGGGAARLNPRCDRCGADARDACRRA
jgi:NADPH:quinone reductase-like Zn-dependent oxidoreductase